MNRRLLSVACGAALLAGALPSPATVTQVDRFETRGSAYERGRQHGRQFRKLIHEDFEQPGGWGYASTFFNRRPDVLVRFVKRLLALPHGQELMDEMQGIAEGAAMPFTDIAALNFTYDLGDREEACSAAMIPRSKDGPFFVNTLDHFPVAKHRRGYPIVAETVYPTKGHAMVLVHIAGTVWANRGVNEAGLAIGDTSGGPGAPRGGANYDGMFYGVLSRYALQFMETTEQAADFIMKYKSVAKGINLPVLDRQGDAAVVEFASRAVGIRRSKEGQPLYASNFFLSDGILDAYGPYDKSLDADGYMINSRARYKRFEELFARTRLDQVGIDFARQIVTDANDGKSGQICQDNQEMYTTSAVIFDCRNATAHLYLGRPSEVEPWVVKLDSSRKPATGAAAPANAQVSAVVETKPAEIKVHYVKIESAAIVKVEGGHLTVKTGPDERTVFPTAGQIRVYVPAKLSDIPSDSRTDITGRKLSADGPTEVKRIVTYCPSLVFIPPEKGRADMGLLIQKGNDLSLAYDKNLPPLKMVLASDHEVLVAHYVPSLTFLKEHAPQLIGLRAEVHGTAFIEKGPVTTSWFMVHATPAQATTLIAPSKPLSSTPKAGSVGSPAGSAKAQVTAPPLQPVD